MPKAILILSCGGVHARYGLESFADMFVKAGRMRRGENEIMDATRKSPPRRIDDYSGVIITGSQSMVTNNSLWSKKLANWIPGLLESGKPTLGVCYGHQIMAKAMGGLVGYHPAHVSVGTFNVTLGANARMAPPLDILPKTFPAHMYHAQVVLDPPPGAKVMGGYSQDPNCVISYGFYQLSVQFHPEFDCRIMRAFTRGLDPLKPLPASEGRPDQTLLMTPLSEAPVATTILRSFVDHCRGAAAKHKPAPAPRQNSRAAAL